MKVRIAGFRSWGREDRGYGSRRRLSARSEHRRSPKCAGRKRRWSSPALRQNASTFEGGDNVVEIAASVAVENRLAVLSVLDAERRISVAVLVQRSWAMTGIIARSVRAGVATEPRSDLSRGGIGC